MKKPTKPLSFIKVVLYPLVLYITFFGPIFIQGYFIPLSENLTPLLVLIICPIAFILLGLYFNYQLLLIHLAILSAFAVFTALNLPIEYLVEQDDHFSMLALSWTPKLLLCYASGFIIYGYLWYKQVKKAKEEKSRDEQQ